MDHYPQKSNFFSKKNLIQKLWKILGILWKCNFLMCSAILKKCAVDVFRSAHQYLSTGLWEVRTDVQEGCSDVQAVHAIKATSAKWAFRAIVRIDVKDLTKVFIFKFDLNVKHYSYFF